MNKFNKVNRKNYKTLAMNNNNASNYIQNIEWNRQIDDTFGVTFDDPDGERIIGGMKYYIHHNRERTRLVIHTRQLSQYSNALLFSMAATIREHFIEIGESYEAICY